MTKNNLILISNQGLRPLLPKLKKQFGEIIKPVTLSVGNVELSMNYAEYIAKKAKDILFQNSDEDNVVYILWSGMPIYNAVVYNVAKEVTNKEPIFLIWNRETELYEEFNINARNLVFGKK